jgi:arylsulfatase A-like enzyme
MQTLHVPLLIIDPRPGRQPRARVSEVVSLRDVGATILDLAGVDARRQGIEGRSLARFWSHGDSAAPAGTTASAPDTILSTLSRGSDNQPWYPVTWGANMYSLVDSAHHYIRNGDGTEELYDARRDPAELHNLADAPESAPVLKLFRSTLSALISRLPPVAEQPVEHPGPPGEGQGR